MVYNNLLNQKVALMIHESKVSEKEQVIKVNVEKSISLAVGDVIYSRNHNDIKYGFYINEIIESRQSSMRDYNYLTIQATYKQI